MKTRWLMILGMGLFAAAAAAQEAAPLKDQKEKISYALGMDLGRQLKAQSLDIDPDLLAAGLRDALLDLKLRMTVEEARAAIAELQNEMKVKQAELAKAQAEKNLKAGEAFLAANKSKEGVVTLPSGLQYKIIQQGSGAKPTLEDTVVCNYIGTLVDGTEFENSYKSKQPAKFQVKGVIKGWSEALQLMTVGSKWQLFIPAGLAYGATARSNQIGPNSTLVFEVELVSIEGK